MKQTLLIIVLCCAAAVFGQKPAVPGYKIRAGERGVTVSFKGKAYRLNVGAHIDAARVTGSELLFASEKNGFRYLLIDVSGWSRKVRNDRQCGAGIESNLIWVKLDARWKIADAKSVRYQSCWSGIDLDEPFVKTAHNLSFDFDNIRDKLKVAVFYDAAAPEKGLQIVETRWNED